MGSKLQTDDTFKAGPKSSFSTKTENKVIHFGLLGWAYDLVNDKPSW